jgi:hypothetical protein
MKPGWPRVRLGKVLRQIERAERVDANRIYRLFGVRWYGQGLFVREERIGAEIAANRLYSVQPGVMWVRTSSAVGWKSAASFVNAGCAQRFRSSFSRCRSVCSWAERNSKSFNALGSNSFSIACNRRIPAGSPRSLASIAFSSTLTKAPAEESPCTSNSRILLRRAVRTGTVRCDRLTDVGPAVSVTDHQCELIEIDQIAFEHRNRPTRRRSHTPAAVTGRIGNGEGPFLVSRILNRGTGPPGPQFVGDPVALCGHLEHLALDAPVLK